MSTEFYCAKCDAVPLVKQYIGRSYILLCRDCYEEFTFLLQENDQEVSPTLMEFFPDQTKMIQWFRIKEE